MAKKLKLSDFKENLQGIEFLRHLVNVYDTRNESLNDNKTPTQLVNEYLKYYNDETDIDGNSLIE